MSIYFNASKQTLSTFWGGDVTAKTSRRDSFFLIFWCALNTTLGQFHQRFTSKFFVWKFVQSQNLSRGKLPKRLSYQKGANKTYMRLTPLLHVLWHRSPIFNKYREAVLLAKRDLRFRIWFPFMSTLFSNRLAWEQNIESVT